MINVLAGFVSVIRAMFDVDFVVVPVSFAVIACLGFIITGFIKERG